jgi:beta-carotene hydroxylase
MRLRHRADRRTLLWTLVFFPLVPALGYVNSSWLPVLLPLELYLAYCAGALVHNHVHSPVFRSRRANAVYSVWLSVFYGFPAFSWIPTHNQNHHRYLNAQGDLTRTTRFSSKNTAWNFLTYPWVSSYFQAPAIWRYARRTWQRGFAPFTAIAAQGLGILAAHGALLALAVHMRGPSHGALLYAATFGIPALSANGLMMFTNYLQHVHCDPESPDDHSRNFVSPLSNWLLFNAGYHTVHHENPGTHWSEYPRLHAQRVHAIAPVLNQDSIPQFVFRTYVLGAFAERYRTRQIG